MSLSCCLVWLSWWNSHGFP